MDSKLVVDKIDMLVSDVNPLFITVLITLLLGAFGILLILYARFLVTEAFKFMNIAVCHPIYYGKQLTGFSTRVRSVFVTFEHNKKLGPSP